MERTTPQENTSFDSKSAVLKRRQNFLASIVKICNEKIEIDKKSLYISVSTNTETALGNAPIIVYNKQVPPSIQLHPTKSYVIRKSQKAIFPRVTHPETREGSRENE